LFLFFAHLKMQFWPPSLAANVLLGVPCVFFLFLVLIISLHVQKTHICRSQTAERITSLMHEKRIVNTPCGSLFVYICKSQFGEIESSINRPLYIAILNHEKGRKGSYPHHPA
jgi:hypothetical protein